MKVSWSHGSLSCCVILTMISRVKQISVRESRLLSCTSCTMCLWNDCHRCLPNKTTVYSKVDNSIMFLRNCWCFRGNNIFLTKQLKRAKRETVNVSHLACISSWTLFTWRETWNDIEKSRRYHVSLSSRNQCNIHWEKRRINRTEFELRSFCIQTLSSSRHSSCSCAFKTVLILRLRDFCVKRLWFAVL